MFKISTNNAEVVTYNPSTIPHAYTGCGRKK